MPSFYGENPPDTEVGSTDATESQVSEDAVTETDTSGGFYQGSPEQTTTEAFENDARQAAEAAETAQEAAEAAQAAAESSESAASSSEANAASSESAAATSATNASNSVSAAAGSATTASTQASNAASSATAAAGSASNAASSESAAASSETAAASSQTAAAGSATAAASSAGTASTKASEADTSATNAAASESAAASSESNASTSASQAATSATNAASSESAAASSETNAASSASAASTSASNAASSASAASSSATAAASSATSAASSATSAGTARDDAQAALDSFDDRYLGAKSSEPTVDNDGDALVAGALFFDTVNTVMKVYDGSQWLAAYASVSGALLAINNLDDVTNTATARSNLGLGTASEQNVTYFATAAQGALADSALQNGDNVSVLTNDAGYATTTYVDNEVAGLVDSAPATLDTLNELAAALGDDANFSTTVTNSIATKWTQDNTKISNWDTAYGWGDHGVEGYLTGNQTITLTGDVSGSGTTSIAVTIADDSHNHVISNVDGLQTALDAKLPSSSYTASDVLTKIKTVDGAGSGLDADTLDGYQFSSLHNVTSNPSTAGNGTLSIGNNGSYSYVQSHSSQPLRLNPLGNALQGPNGSTIWHSGNDGSGSGLDADLLDGMNASSSVVANTIVARQANGYIYANHINFSTSETENPTISSFITSNGDGWSRKSSKSHVISQLSSGLLTHQAGSRQSINFNSYLTQGFYNAANGNSNKPSGAVDYGQLIVAKGIDTGLQIYGGYANTALYWRGWASSGGTLYNWHKLWSDQNDGSGSGLDADLLDGQQGSYYQPASTAITTGNIGSQSVSSASNIDGISFRNGNSSNGIGPDYVQENGTGYINSVSLFGQTDGALYSQAYSTAWVHQIFGDYRTGNLAVRGRLNGTWQSWKTVWTSANDGSGSGLDADLLDGIDSTYFNRGDNAWGAMVGTIGWNLNDVFTNRNRSGFFDVWNGSNFPPGTTHVQGLQTRHATSTHYGWQLAGQYNQTGILYTRGVSNSSFGAWSKIWTDVTDGSGSGLDADLLDGLNSSSFLRSDAATSGTTITATDAFRSFRFEEQDGTFLFRVGSGSGTTRHINLWDSTGDPSQADGAEVSGISWGRRTDNNPYYIIYADKLHTYNGDYSKLILAWHTGVHIGASQSYGGTRFWSDAPGVGSPSELMSVGKGDSHVRIANNLYIGSGTAWHSTNDGSGSGLDADLLDGINSSSFARRDGNNSYSTNVYNYFRVERGGYCGSINTASLQAYTTGANSAFMSFHRGGYYAVNMGLDADNVLRIGGWSASANRWVLDMSGNMTAAGNVTAYSDIRLKENIKVIPDALEKVQKIRGVTFTRNDQEDKEKLHTGVIAQEVEAVLPEVISEDNLGIKNVAYGNMVGLLIEAIKELKAEVDDLKAQLKGG